ncbi:DUF5011 domain-containing protein, partial [Sulfurovum sp. bin170]|uniref:DUF5011 domain-containing protein n=1 Tax=Sulfurovum sp. bin170 TaxID=2695268 RepID=UPI0013E05015
MNYRKSLTIFLMIILLGNFASAIVYEDAENENSTQSWQVYDNIPTGAVVSRVFDSDKQSNIIELMGAGMENGYILGSFDETQSWNNREDNLLTWSISCSEYYTIYILINTQKGYRYLYYTPHDVDYGMSNGSQYIHFGLGTDSTDGQWRTFSRDIKADLKKFEIDNELISVNAFLIRGDAKLDDIEMSGGEDNTKPTITLIGDSLVTVIQDTTYIDAGATAEDNIDGDVTVDIVTQNSVDTAVLGTYTVTYDVNDSSGNQAIQQMRTVSVVTSTDTAKDVLILYDTAGSFGHMGKTNAIFLENLLGHFDLNVISKPTSQYVENEMNSKKAVFYLGTTYDVLSYYSEGSAEKLAYQKFYRDVATKDRTIVWINYNLPLLEQFWIDNNLDNNTFA